MFKRSECLKRLEEIRKKLLISNAELVEAIGISYQTFYRMRLSDDSAEWSNKVIKNILKFIEEYKDI